MNGKQRNPEHAPSAARSFRVPVAPGRDTVRGACCRRPGTAGRCRPYGICPGARRTA